jgi:hypothetical protein
LKNFFLTTTGNELTRNFCGLRRLVSVYNRK